MILINHIMWCRVDPVMASSHLLSRLAEFVSETRFDLDTEITAIIRDSVIDTLGCCLVGIGEEVTQMSSAAIDPIAGDGATVFGSSMRASAESAAFLNTVSGHALELDDWEAPGNTHSSVVIVPALLAAGAGDSLSGRRFCEAYIAGFEVIARLGEACNFEHYARGWHTTGTLAAIGAAAAVSRLWGLDAVKTAHAMSLAVSRTGGLTRQFGSHAKPLQAGFAAETGVRVARLARAGITGQPHVLEGDQGYFALTGHTDAQRQQAPFEKLGETLALIEYGQIIKAYPSCGYTHRIIDCARDFFSRGLDLEKVRSIRIEVPDFHAAILPFALPANRREALFSLPYCAAMGLTSGNLALEDLDRESWNDQPVQSLISRCRVEPFVPRRPEMNYDPDQPDRLTLETPDGEKIETMVRYPRGAPQNRLSLDEIMCKFRYHATRYHNPDESAIDALADWPQLEDVHPLFNQFGVEK